MNAALGPQGRARDICNAVHKVHPVHKVHTEGRFALAALAIAAPAQPILPAADVQFLQQVSAAVVDASRVAPGNFRKGPEFGSPWECLLPANNHRQNPVYMTSVTCQLAAFLR